MYRSIILAGLVVAMLGGCASAPEKSASAAAAPAASPAPATSVSAPAAAPAPVAQTSTAPTTTVVPGSTVAQNPELLAAEKVPAGYRAIQRDGQTLYCQSMTTLGSRFPKQVCMTPSEYKDSINRRDSMRNELEGRQKSYFNNP